MATLNLLTAAYNGKLGATVGQKSSRGSVIRTHVVPENPKTPKQQDVRRKFAEIQMLAKMVANPVASLLGYKYPDKSAYNAWISFNMKFTFPPPIQSAVANLSLSPTVNTRMGPWFANTDTVTPSFGVSIQGLTPPWQNMRSWGFIFCPESGMFISGPGTDNLVYITSDRAVQPGHTLYGGGFFYGDAFKGLGVTWGPIMKAVKP